MLTKIQKWGNSQGVRLPKGVLQGAGIDVGAEVEIVVKDGSILINPVRKIRGKYRLEDLVKRAPKGSVGEVDWGKPLGKEVW